MISQSTCFLKHIILLFLNEEFSFIHSLVYCKKHQTISNDSFFYTSSSELSREQSCRYSIQVLIKELKWLLCSTQILSIILF